MTNIRNTVRNLATEAKAEEIKVIGRHRKELTANQKIAHKAHRIAVHVYHTGQLTAIGLPAILAFEAARPLWERFVETPISETLFGTHATTHAEALSTLSQYYFG